MRLRQIWIALAVVFAVACGGGGKKPDTTTATTTTGEKPLYDRLGGRDAIVGVVNEFVTSLKADARVNTRFENADLKNLKDKLVEQICQATGGPCTYTGKSMKDAHMAMGITEADWNAVVEDLAKALDKFSVPEKEKSELLGALGGMKGDIVAP